MEDHYIDSEEKINNLFPSEIFAAIDSIHGLKKPIMEFLKPTTG